MFSQSDILLPRHSKNTVMAMRNNTSGLSKHRLIKYLLVFLVVCAFILGIYTATATAIRNSNLVSSSFDGEGLHAVTKTKLTVSPVKSNVATDCIKIKPKPSFPDLDYAFLGYHILKGYPLANGHDPGFTNPIFKADYSTQRETGDRKYSVPTGYTIIPDVSCQTSFISQVIRNTKDLKDSMEIAAKVYGGGWGLSFGASADYQKAHQSMESEGKVLVVSRANCQYYYAKIDEVNPPPFADSFLESLQRLNNSNSREEFLDFMSYYGTHFLKVVDFGARYLFEHSMTEENYQALQQQSISVEAQASYSSWLFTAGGSASLTTDQQSAVTKFNQLVETKIITVGSTPPTDGNALTWASTVQETPVPFRYELASIEELFTSIYMDKYPDINKNNIRRGVEFIRIWSSEELFQREVQAKTGCRVYNATFKLPNRTCIDELPYSFWEPCKDCIKDSACLGSTWAFFEHTNVGYVCLMFNSTVLNVTDIISYQGVYNFTNCSSMVLPNKLKLLPSKLGHGQLAGKLLINNLKVKNSSHEHTSETCIQHPQTCEDSCLLDNKCVLYYRRQDLHNKGAYCCGLVDQVGVDKLEVVLSSDVNEYIAFIKTDC